MSPVQARQAGCLDCANFRLLDDCLLWADFLKIKNFFLGISYATWVGPHGLGDFFTNSSGHPADK
jgi:hypothetical protein